MEVLAPKFKDVKSNEYKESDGVKIVETEHGHTFKIYQGSKPDEKPSAFLRETVTSADLLNRVPLYEAATTSEFPDQLREDFRVIMLSSFQSVQDSLLPIFFTVQSTKTEETYAGINKLKKTPGIRREDTPYFVLGTTAKDQVIIRNWGRGGIVEITEDMIRFDKSNEITRLAAELGDSVAYERFQLLTDVMTTAASTTAQSSTVTLTPTNLENMLTTYQTQTDTASSKKLSFNADTLVVPAQLQWTARRILESSGIPGSADNDVNVLKGILNLVVNPLLDTNSTTRFYIGRARNPNGLIYQNVIGPTPETFTQDARQSQVSDDVFFYDLVRYKSRLHYGQGIVDIRYWHRSTT